MPIFKLQIRIYVKLHLAFLEDFGRLEFDMIIMIISIQNMVDNSAKRNFRNKKKNFK